MNDVYKRLLTAEIGGALSAARGAEAIEHLGLRGRVREVFISRLLKPYLYPTMGICTGKVIDSYNQQSAQVDVIVYDKHIIPPIMVEENGFVPIEAVVATIEVKSTLTRAELKKSLENARSVQGLRPRIPMELQGMNFSSPVGGLFAFKSDLTAGDEIARLQEVVQEIAPLPAREGVTMLRTAPPITNLCIANKQCSHNQTDGSWITDATDVEHKEVRSFVMGIMNTIRLIVPTRIRPEIGTYFMD